MRRSSFIAGVLAVAFLIPVSGLAQFGQGSIQGKVLDRDGKPLQGAIARIQNTSTRQIDEGKTNKNGGYSVTGLYQGKYKVTLVVDGHAVMVRGESVGDDLFVTSGQDTTVNFDMRKAPATPPPDVAPLPATTGSKGKTDAEKKANEAMRAAFTAGMSALKAQNFDEAIKQLQLAGEKDPSQPAIFGNLGLAYLRTKKYDDAIEVLRKSLELKPDDAGVHLSL